MAVRIVEDGGVTSCAMAEQVWVNKARAFRRWWRRTHGAAVREAFEVGGREGQLALKRLERLYRGEFIRRVQGGALVEQA